MVGVCLDDDRDAARTAAREDAAPFPSVFDARGYDAPHVRALGIRSIPAAVLAGPDGRILERRVHPAELLRRGR